MTAEYRKFEERNSKPRMKNEVRNSKFETKSFANGAFRKAFVSNFVLRISSFTRRFEFRSSIFYTDA